MPTEKITNQPESESESSSGSSSSDTSSGPSDTPVQSRVVVEAPVDEDVDMGEEEEEEEERVATKPVFDYVGNARNRKRCASKGDVLVQQQAIMDKYHEEEEEEQEEKEAEPVEKDAEPEEKQEEEPEEKEAENMEEEVREEKQAEKQKPKPVKHYGKGGVGKGGFRRHRRHSLRGSVYGISKNDIRRLARRGGVKRIHGLIYEETRGCLKEFLEEIIRTTICYTEHARRKTVTSMDVVYALKQQGKTLYGFGG